jgi:Zn-dependent metalloprotease
MKQNYLRAIALLFFYLGYWVIPDAYSQYFYKPLQFGQIQPPDPGKLGTLYNWEPYLMMNLKTTYHGKQNVYATAYLPYVASEYDVDHTPELFGPHYTTGLALCSPKNPALGLYAPVEIVSADDDSYYAFAGVVPYDNNQANYKGPFNTLKRLNEQSNGFVNPVSDEDALSALGAAQKFPKFTFDLFKDANGVGWAGFDKTGTVPIVCVLTDKQGDTGYNSDVIIIQNTKGFDTFVTRAAIGHEISHGILNHALGMQNGLFVQSMKELDEGLADILGYSFSIWLEPEKFDNPTWFFNWEVYPEIASDKFYTFHNPKDYELPSTYKGEFYYEDVQYPKYEVHSNGSVLKNWFAKINDGGKGYVDGKNTNDYFEVFPLIPGDKEDTYKLALQILFKAFTEKLSLTAGYPELRVASLEAATELGHGPGSHAYLQIMAAWDLVNVTETLHNVKCTTATAESILNGPVTFNVRERTLSPSLLSQKIRELFDCSNPNNVKTMFRTGLNRNIFTDWDNDLNFSKTNDADESKLAVTVHGFTQVARDWYKKTIDYDGLRGGEPVLITNEIGDFPGVQVKFEVDQTDIIPTFQYPSQKKFISRDEISKRYFQVIDLYAKYDQIQFQSVTKEWNTIVRSMGEILSLATKRDYEKEHQNPDSDNIWTLFEDLSDPTLLRDFSNPKLYGQPAVYQGALWDANNYVNNTGFMNLCYYLLVHGTVNGATNVDEGYTNDEPGSLTYFINKMDKDVVLKSFWKAYLNTPANSGIEQFRMATMDALHAQGFDAKSKEHIAFYDAWAAVLALPDYASTLKHYPEEGAVIHPWMPINEMPGMFGVEVEYITYESSRLFEVSKSATFNANEAPVYQFLNKTAPDMVTGMTYADVYLEPGQTYYVHSRLSNTGDPHLGCAETPDPAFCESLKGKKKWTVTYKIHTSEVGPVEVQNPKAGETIAAWASPFSWMSKAGADGYGLQMSGGGIADILMGHDEFYDEDNAQVPVEAVLALSKLQNYSWSVAARRRTGSPWAVHVWPNGMTYPFTDDEKEALPYAYGNWGEVRDFKTDLPTLTPGAYPADGQHVPLIGAPIILTSSSIANAGNNYNFEYKEPYKLFLNTGQPAFSMHVSNIPGIVDQQAVEWAFTPVKAATAPFILAEEKGATVWRTFIADLSLSAKPELEPVKCFSPSAAISKWSAVADAQGYKYSFKEAGTNQEVASGITDQLASPIITTAGGFPNPGKYIRTVSAGVKNSNNVWLFGPEASDTYGVRPPAPINLTPVGGTVTLGDNHSVTFNWANGPSAHIDNTHHFSLVKVTGNGEEFIPGFQLIEVNGNQLVVPDLEFNTTYHWLVNNHSDLVLCGSEWAQGSFTTAEKPVSFIPEVGFNFLVLAPDVWGLDIGGVTYNVTVNNPDGSVFHRMGLISNTTNQISYDPQSNDINNGKLPTMDGVYHVTVIFTEIRDYVKLQDFLPIWGITVTAMDVGPIVDNAGPAVQLDSHSKTGDFTPVVNGQLHLTFTFDSVNHTISQIQQQ